MNKLVFVTRLLRVDEKLMSRIYISLHCFTLYRATLHCVASITVCSSSLWVSRTGSVSDWCALQGSLYKCMSTIQNITLYLHLHYITLSDWTQWMHCLIV